MKFMNETILKDMVSTLFNRFGKKGLLDKIDDLEERLSKLELNQATISQPKPRGRPRKVHATND